LAAPAAREKRRKSFPFSQPGKKKDASGSIATEGDKKTLLEEREASVPCLAVRRGRGGVYRPGEGKLDLSSLREGKRVFIAGMRKRIKDPESVVLWESRFFSLQRVEERKTSQPSKGKKK